MWKLNDTKKVTCSCEYTRGITGRHNLSVSKAQSFGIRLRTFQGGGGVHLNPDPFCFSVLNASYSTPPKLVSTKLGCLISEIQFFCFTATVFRNLRNTRFFQVPARNNHYSGIEKTPVDYWVDQKENRKEQELVIISLSARAKCWILVGNWPSGRLSLNTEGTFLWSSSKLYWKK